MNTPIKRIILLLLASALMAISGTSCRTFQGFGRDMSHAGGHIERAAR